MVRGYPMGRGGLWEMYRGPGRGSFPHENEFMHLRRVSFSLFWFSIPFCPGLMGVIAGRVFALTVSPV
jgi:hypothetical protein